MRINRVQLSILWSTFVIVVGAIGACELAAFDIATKSPLNDPDDSSTVSPIDRLKRRLAEEQITDHVVLKFKFIELPMNRLPQSMRIFGSLAAIADNKWWRSPAEANRLNWGLPDLVGFQQVDRNPDVPVWSTPEISVIAGQEAKFSLGERHPIARTNEDGEVTTTDAEDSHSVIAKASILTFNRVRVDVEGVFQGQTKGHGPHRDEGSRRIQATFDMEQGETQAFARRVVSSSGKESLILVFATAWIKPFAIPDDPDADSVSAVNDLSSYTIEAARIKAAVLSAMDQPRNDFRVVAGRFLSREEAVYDDSPIAKPRARNTSINMSKQVRISLDIVELNFAGIESEFEAKESKIAFGFRVDPCPPEYWKRFMVAFVEADSETPQTNMPPDTEVLNTSTWLTDQHQDLVKKWRSHPSSRRWSFPNIVAKGCERFECEAGGEIPTLKLGPNRSEQWRREKFGASIIGTAWTIEDSDSVRLGLDISLKDLEETLGGLKVTNARRLQTDIRVLSGHAIYLGQPIVSEMGQETFLCIRILAQIVPRYLSGEQLADLEVDSEAVVSALQPNNAPRLDAKCSSPRSPADEVHLVSWTDSVSENYHRSEKIDRICRLIRWHTYSLVDDAELFPNSAELGRNSFIGHKESELDFINVRRGWTGQQQLRQWQPKPRLRGVSVFPNELPPQNRGDTAPHFD